MPGRLITLLVGCLVSCSLTVSAQTFIKDYRQHITNTEKHRGVTDQMNLSIKRLQEAFSKYTKLTNINMLNSDSLYMVHYYKVESGEYTNVIWNREHSFLYRYQFGKSVKLDTNASQWVKGYKPEFRRWVETADTSGYGKYGRQSSWLDAPSISFTVATKQKKIWHFVTSSSYANNVDLSK
jgi:cell division protein FtsL